MTGSHDTSRRGEAVATSERDQGLELIVLTRALRMNATVQGLVTGVFAGLALFLATNWLVLKGGPVVGPHLSLLSQYFIGYRVSFLGSLIGFGYAFVTGFAVGYGVATLYNRFLDLRRGGRRGMPDATTPRAR